MMMVRREGQGTPNRGRETFGCLSSWSVVCLCVVEGICLLLNSFGGGDCCLLVGSGGQQRTLCLGLRFFDSTTNSSPLSLFLPFRAKQTSPRKPRTPWLAQCLDPGASAVTITAQQGFLPHLTGETNAPSPPPPILNAKSPLRSFGSTTANHTTHKRTAPLVSSRFSLFYFSPFGFFCPVHVIPLLPSPPFLLESCQTSLSLSHTHTSRPMPRCETRAINEKTIPPLFLPTQHTHTLSSRHLHPSRSSGRRLVRRFACGPSGRARPPLK